jgi:hypothetical protein
MTVRELREYLMTVDDCLEVIVENKSELRRLKKEDISMDRNQVNPSNYYLDDEDEPVGEDGVLILGTWS